MNAKNRSRKQKSQRLKSKRQDNNREHGSEYYSLQSHEQTENFKNVIFMRHGMINFSYHTSYIYFIVHKLLEVIRKFVDKNSSVKKNMFHRTFAKLIKKTKEVLSKFIHQDIDYGNLDYQQFMRFLLYEIDPPLAEDNGINIKKLPEELDVIYHSSAKRSIESAKYVQRFFIKSGKQPKIENCLKKELDEVRFSKNILSKDEFKEYHGLEGARPIILTRWYEGTNREETFQDSIIRVERLCNILKKSPDKNILLITHAWYLRLLYMYFKNQEKSLENLRSGECIFKYGESFQIRLRQDFSPHISFYCEKDANLQSESLAESVENYGKFSH